MRLHRLEIENFRGIRKLDWQLPSSGKLTVLIGSGDTGKSTILEAIDCLLGDRWNIPFSDTDFFNAEPQTPILIRATLTDLPSALLTDKTFGLWQSGLDATGSLQQDPSDGATPCLLACLRVDASLEPQWTVERMEGQAQSLTSSQRRHFATFKVDDRVDAQLRWTRTSALGRLSSENGADRAALAAASRAARAALEDDAQVSLSELAETVQARANDIGGGRFSRMRAGLDTSRSAQGAGLALYEDVIPLSSFGQGTKRLTSLAVQQMAARGERAIALVDEIEAGLEPHRAVKLLAHLASDDSYEQVLVTSHSPVVVEQATLESLSVVQNADGIASVRSLNGDVELLQRLRRSRPSSLLARRIVVGEGKTEHGVLMAFFEAADSQRVSRGLSTSAGEGLAVQDGQGGSEVAPRALALVQLGYAVAALLDNDDRTVDAAVAAAEQAGVDIVRWDLGQNIEAAVVADLGTDLLNSFLDLGLEVRNSAATVLADLQQDDLGAQVRTLNVGDWLASGMELETARLLIARVSTKREWFKKVEPGQMLGRWIIEHADDPALGNVLHRLARIHRFVYQEDSVETAEGPLAVSHE